MKKRALLPTILMSTIIYGYSQNASSNNIQMIIQTQENILDCPHFSNLLCNEAAKEFGITFIEKNENKKQIIFDVSNYKGNLDSLKVYYERYIQRIQLPTRYFKEIYYITQ